MLDWPIRTSRSKFPVVWMLSPIAPATSLHAGRLNLWHAALLLVCLLAAGCAAATAVRRGRDAERLQEYDRAVVEYSKAVRLNPDDLGARAGLERAKLRAAEAHYNRGRRLAAAGKYDQALVEYQMASELNPTSGDIDDELRATRNKL